MKFSVIIPAYNVDQYIACCIESLLCQNIDLEIVIINDGSTDETGNIVEWYRLNHSIITVIHQIHSGISISRNRGLEIAKGEYIAFVDSDDWITEGVLNRLYAIAVENKADMVMGNTICHYPDGSEKNLFDIYLLLKNRIYTDKQCFISLMEVNVYNSVVWAYIYNHEWIKKHHFRFEADIIHEDEAWTPIVLCQADFVAIANVDYYHYRLRKGSVMHTLKWKDRLQALFLVIQQLLAFTAKYEKEDTVLSSWLYVNIYRIMRITYQVLSCLNDSSFRVPDPDAIDIYNQVGESMPLKARERCEKYYLMAKEFEKEYLKWKNNPWDLYLFQLSEQERQNKKIILIFNSPKWYNHVLSDINLFPSSYAITLDRKYRDKAYAIVFYLPDLIDQLDEDMEKPENQIWIAWGFEENDSWSKDEDFNDLFDIRLTCQDIPDTGLNKKNAQKATLFTELCYLLNEFEI